ncbi:hypothetical protein C731_1468 [Mycolicibacterium hassiacum DSM 44199]|jgi:mycothiol synthase|uniref:Uncharacterized protein n=1 Tax=Mycolicibacterium hassiacum (strain DSM 44199 / CIP 105218 / JCM 12690 / 3849) TaxID=1122247 RepID=K5B8Z0_MYCHD|nr:hypothetical protein [Mycolicibacterium hassiacum]EKF24533.1 hypothetical protein C731_1468 [Mycolicibacterium hassiacum DSM 44199]MBX5488268.1 hypothetical protein [Mycolicibacterium hassiacum]MDA4084345.1 hypothetical protein [Mycolicibacterium hassiacum DSM 44199]VCT88975.1 Mycothiol acetyltransferase [Mycolicibacterium hassiacum DSM 44199]
MIEFEWRTELSDAELAELTDVLTRAAHFDAAPEYNTISVEEIIRSMPPSYPRAHHLLIWMLPYATALGGPEHPKRIAGVLRLVTAPDGTAHACLVIDPQLRSLGISTLLFERIGLDCSGPEGWAGTGAHTIIAWARGNHPAAGRLTRRFLIPRTRRVWKLIRPTSPLDPAAVPPVLEPTAAGELRDVPWLSDVDAETLYVLRDGGEPTGAAALDFTPFEHLEFGKSASLTAFRVAPDATVRTRRALLDGAAAVAKACQFTGLVAYVESNDSEWVTSCRLTGFQHDRTDVCFQVGGQQ